MCDTYINTMCIKENLIYTYDIWALPDYTVMFMFIC